MPLPRLRPAAPRATRVTTTTTEVLRRLDVTLLGDLLLAAAPSLSWSGDVALLAEGRDGQRVSGAARELLQEVSSAVGVLVVTPDVARPDWVAALDGHAPDTDQRRRVAWCSSTALCDVVEAVLSDPLRRLTDHSRPLLTELLAFWDSLGLRTLDDTVVVATRTAWPEYLSTSAFITSPGRSLRGGTTHLGFYVDDEIADVVPAIERSFPAVRFTPAAAVNHRERGESALADVIEASLASGTRTEGATHAVLLLTSPDHQSTVRLQRRVVDDATSAGGRRTAWTTSQRYTAVERLLAGAAATSQL